MSTQESPRHLRRGEFVELTGTGYSVSVTQYSNKGPLFIVKDSSGREVGRARFALDGLRWHTMESLDNPADAAPDEDERPAKPCCPHCHADNSVPILYRNIDAVTREDNEDFERCRVEIRQHAPTNRSGVPLPRRQCRKCHTEF